MATPKLDAIHMGFVRSYADMYQSGSETKVTLASHDGEDFSVVQRTDMAVRAINDLLQMAAEEVNLGIMERDSFANFFSEYKLQATVDLTVSGYEGTGDLPDNFILELSARLQRTGQVPVTVERARATPEKHYNLVLSGTDPEQYYVPAYRIVGTKVYVAYVNPEVPFESADDLILQYFSYQPETTQGTGTDVLIRPVWNNRIIAHMINQAREFAKS